MKELYIASIITVITGVLMMIFRKPWGVAFCRLGKASFRLGGRFARSFPYEQYYDEAKAPASFKLMGIVFILTGLGFAVIAWLLRNG